MESYTLGIHAIDRGVPELTGSTQIHLELLDVNDSPPQFASANYSANVQVRVHSQGRSGDVTRAVLLL